MSNWEIKAKFNYLIFCLKIKIKKSAKKVATWMEEKGTKEILFSFSNSFLIV